MVEGWASEVHDGSASDKVGEAGAPKLDDLAVTQWPASSSSEFGNQVAESPLVQYENDASAPVGIWDSGTVTPRHKQGFETARDRWICAAPRPVVDAKSASRVGCMTLLVDVVFQPEVDTRPEPGSRVVIELRDTSLEDAPAITMEAAEGVVAPGRGPLLATVELLPPRAPLTVWAHVDADGDGRVSVGDLVTMESFLVPSPEQAPARIAVTVRQVR
jgi:hypothetical protein